MRCDAPFGDGWGCFACVAPIGKPKCVTAEMVKPGAVVVDVGVNRTDDNVDYDQVREVASLLVAAAIANIY